LILLFAWIILKLNIVIIVSLLIKTGIPPLIRWVLQINWKWKRWVIFLTLHKCLPFLIIIICLNNLLFILLWPLISVIYFYRVNEWFEFIWASSISDSAWICVRAVWKYFWLFFMRYRLLWWIWRKSKITQTIKNTSPFRYFLFILILAIPPRVLFFIKIIIWINLSISLGIVLRIFSWIILFIYWKWINFTLVLNSSISQILYIFLWRFGFLTRHFILILS